MKNKILKTSVIIILIMTLTMTNFLFLGSSMISYATDNITTNHKNIEFSTYFKNANGEKTSTLERTADIQEASLYVSVNVKKEGFFTGEIALTDANFNLASSESEFVSNIADNTIYLNQINAGASVEIEVKIKPINDEKIDLNMLNCESKLTLTGTYRDSTEKDIAIKATRNVTMELIEANTDASVKNTIQVITNKVLKISGEDKRVLQLSLNMGLEEGNYPIKEMYAKINVPEINGKLPEIRRDINLNTMSASEYKYENGYIEITLKNETSKDNQIVWKKQGNENIILTYIYDADVNLENVEIFSEETVTLYNNKQLNSNTGNVTVTNQESDATIEVTAENLESSIYKGKLYSNIERQYNSKTVLDVNLANVQEYISIKEEASQYRLSEEEVESNIYYQATTINKESFNKIFGEEGTIEIYNEKNEQLGIINHQTQTDEKGNFVIDYTGREPKSIEIKTSKPIAEGSIEWNHTKIIKPSDANTLKAANRITTKVVYGYNHYDENDLEAKEATYTMGKTNQLEMKLPLEESVTEARLELNRTSLSTVVANELEMKLVLKTDEESRDLYKNPTFTIELPEQVEHIQINRIDLLYEEELKIANYKVEGRYITIQMEGEQTQYKAQSIEGANVIINATINVNRTSIAKPENIYVTYTNEKANEYANHEEVGNTSKQLEIVAPKDVTAINSMKDLNIETIGEEETANVSLERGADSKQVQVDFEIINNNEENIENVNIMGTFPTKTEENTMNIKVVDSIQVNNGTVYYTENEEATADINHTENGWSQEISNPETVKKYLIVMDTIDSRTVVNGSYKIEIPENLEYNQVAKEGYEVIYTKGQARSQNSVKATTIAMGTGVGPKLESNLTATLAGKELTDSNTVKNGEVIKYKVQVSNVGSENVTDVKVKGSIPEGTILVEPVDNYEYTGASYYKRVDAEAFETTIDQLAVGEVKYVEYEVMVNANTAENTSIANTAEINYLDVVQETNEIKVLSELGNLRTMVKRVTDRKVDLYERGMVEYFAIIKNISSETMEDVTVKTNKSENLNVARLTLISGMSENEVSDDELYSSSAEATTEGREENDDTINENTQSEIIEYSDEIHIGTLAPGEVKVLSYNMTIDKMPDNATDTIYFSVNASDGQKEYQSNRWEDKVNSFDIDMTMQTNTESKYVKSGDSIQYIITVKNNSTSPTSGLVIRDEIPSQLTINKVTRNGEEVQVHSNNVEIQNEIPANGTMTIVIETVVDYSEGRTEAETITNKAIASIYGEQIATTSGLNHIIEADKTTVNTPSEDNPPVDNPSEDDNPNTDDSGNHTGSIANGEQMISGLAWYDENGNGKKDEEENTLNDITVKLLNVETNQLVKDTSGKVLTTKTNENGMYVLDHIANGQYIVIFEYNQDQYTLTKYKAEGISDAENSDVRRNELKIGDEKQEVASTDMIHIDNENIEDINIGLIKLQNFDLKLDKYVSRILVQNSAGTTTREYNNTKTAKVELDAKQIQGSNVIVEYNIVVTNVGEVAGYARSIVDYMPNDLEFSSELNKDWYEQGNSLYTTALGNEIINPGESKTITLTLTKKMGEDNVVSRNNAEIYEDYNNLGFEDGNSIPGNRVNGENDMGTADVIISIRTGGVVYMSIGIIIAIIVIAGITTAVIVKRKNAKEEQ